MYIYNCTTSHNRRHGSEAFLHHHHCPALNLLVWPGRLLLLLPQIPATLGHENQDSTGGNRRRLEVGKEIAGSICKYLEMACVKAKPLRTLCVMGGQEKQVQQARHLSWMERRHPVPG